MAQSPSLSPTAETIRLAATPLSSSSGDYTPLLEWIGEASIVVIGESTSGTHEFVKARSAITKQLIEHLGFTAIAADADWQAALRLHHFILNHTPHEKAIDALSGFHHFPSWVWRNADLLDFIGWLRSANEHRPPSSQVGFYGLDLLSYHRTLNTLSDFLKTNAPATHQEARQLFAQLETPDIGEETPASPLSQATEAAITRYLQDRAEPPVSLPEAADAPFYTALRANRPPFGSDLLKLLQNPTQLQNRRDCQMAHATDAVLKHLQQLHGTKPPKLVIWAHHSHVGDTRAIESTAPANRVNLGQLLRERYAAKVVLVGLTTHHGSVTVAPGWGCPAERVPLPPAPPGGSEQLLHQSGLSRFMLPLQSDEETTELFTPPLPQRGVGAICHPAEAPPSTLNVSLAEQYDVIIHFDETRAVEPLEEDPTL